MSKPIDKNHAEDAVLAKQIRASQGPNNVVETTLQTDERVIARVTDGIYRQPGSALRELISNAYDADASRVIIKTDAPRFERISIEDDGHGMGPEALAHLLRHIGGSAKRSMEGQELGVTSSDPLRSPKGRRLIGKIGIGLFSVSQLTQTFQIVTKVKGDDYRTVAIVALRQYADDDAPLKKGEKHTFESGKVNIWREKATDIDSHGTTIILTNIRPQARDTLRSKDIWSVVDHKDLNPEGEEQQDVDPPRFHIGRVDATGNLFKPSTEKPTDAPWSLPWEKGDAPDQAFQKLVQSVWDEVNQSTPNPRLDRIFDYYLRMIWQLSLAVPLPYVEGHLFDLRPSQWADSFMLSNQPKGAAQEIKFVGSKSIREQAGLENEVKPADRFSVFFDDLQLFRPLKFENLPTTGNALKNPLIFIGKCREEFSKVERALSGGPLAFEAYLFWTPKVAPVEHQGALIRIHGSSGTLFDQGFMRYQISENTRLKQITCEIFVAEGLDSALNIDRESFNNAHPHSVYITKWLHNALRQVATTQKRLASEIRKNTRDESKDAVVSEIQRVANETWREQASDLSENPPAIELFASDSKLPVNGDSYAFSRTAIISEPMRTQTTKTKAKDAILEEKIKAIAQVLASFGLLEEMPKRKQEKLLKALYKILETADE